MLLHLSSARALVAAALGRDARHLRRVARDPGGCTVGDVERLMRAHGVPEEKVSRAVDRLADIELSAPLAWAYAMAYDGTELAEALGEPMGAASRGTDGTRG